MRTVTAREVQHRLSEVLDEVQKGRQFTITRRGKIVAKLIPAQPKPKKKLEWPDFEARMKRIFPDGAPPGKPASEIIMDELREDRF
jgi:prevent-host-death family protein